MARTSLIVFALTLISARSLASELTSRKIDQVQLEEPFALSFFQEIAKKTHSIIPMGIEADDVAMPPDLNPQAAKTLRLENTTVGGVLDDICNKTAAEWREDHGVLNIYPLGAAQKKDYILNWVVNVDVEGLEREDIVTKIFDDWSKKDSTVRFTSTGESYEVHHGSSTLILFGHKSTGEPGLGIHSAPRHTILTKGMTFRRVLNEIARRERSYWLVMISSDSLQLVFP